MFKLWQKRDEADHIENIEAWLMVLTRNRALDILRMEVGDGLLDPLLVDTFIDARVFARAGVLRT